VPSKALIASAKRAHAIREAAAYGIRAPEADVDFEAVMERVAGVIASIAPTDSVERFRGLGCEVIEAEARFTARRTIEAGGYRIEPRIAVIATGSRPVAPPVPGIETVPYLTNETLFENRTRPEHLLILGGGAIGLEMEQAHRRLGSRVTVIEAGPRILARDDAEAAAIIATALRREGIVLRENAKASRVEPVSGGGVAVILDGGERIEGSHLLVAAGRKPNIESLNLEAAGIETENGRLKVDDRLKTTNHRVYAVGDVAGGPAFTHVANYHAGLVIRRALFFYPARVDYAAVPWCTYTDPELAQVGLTEEQARARAKNGFRIVRWPVAENDRARAEGYETGFVKAVTDKAGAILGCTIVAPHAGELIQSWGLAIGAGLKFAAFASQTVAYPTMAEISKRAASSYFTPTLFSPRVRGLVGFLAKFG